MATQLRLVSRAPLAGETGTTGASSAAQHTAWLTLWNDYQAQRKSYSESYADTRRAAILATPKLQSIKSYPPHASTPLKAEVIARLQRTTIEHLADNLIEDLVAALDQELLYSLDTSRGTFRGGSGIFTPEDLAYVQSQPSAAAWQGLLTGAGGAYPALTLGQSYDAILASSGLTGLRYYALGAPVKLALERGDRECPADPGYQAFRAAKAPLLTAPARAGYAGARQLGGISNLAAFAAMRNLAGVYSGSGLLGGSTTDPPTGAMDTGLPWGTILIVALAAGLVWFFFFRGK